jgi:hypothetical protein
VRMEAVQRPRAQPSCTPLGGMLGECIGSRCDDGEQQWTKHPETSRVLSETGPEYVRELRHTVVLCIPFLASRLNTLTDDFDHRNELDVHAGAHLVKYLGLRYIAPRSIKTHAR